MLLTHQAADNSVHQPGGMQLMITLSIIIKGYSKSKKRAGRGIQWITTIDNEDLDIVRMFLSIGVQVRHL
jgi:hypothetical protein